MTIRIYLLVFASVIINSNASAQPDSLWSRTFGGREITQLVNGMVTAGSHKINWDCSACATGVYLIELTSGSYRQITKAMLLR